MESPDNTAAVIYSVSTGNGIMKLSPAEWAYLEKRANLIRVWPWVGGVLLLLIVAFTAWLWFTVPYFVNPWAVFAALKSGTVPDSTLGVMAAMLPVVMLTLLAFAALMVFLMFVTLFNERRLIRFIQRQVESPDNEDNAPR